MRSLIALITLGWVCVAAASPAADEHLLLGAEHFRAGRFDQALVEFKVAQQLGDPGEAAWYAAAALQKLQRSEEAVEAFARAERAAPGASDAVLDYYRALALYDARLYLAADQVLASVGERSGPKIAEQAAKVRADIASLFAAEPATGAVDWYLARGELALSQKRGALAEAYFAEALALNARRAAPHRRDEAEAGMKRARDLSTPEPNR